MQKLKQWVSHAPISCLTSVRKLAEWDDDESTLKPGPLNKWRFLVILKHMFTLEELKLDPAALLDIKEDIREQAEECGTVTNVVLYDKEPDGVASVRFKESEAAEAFVRITNNRMFDGRRVESFVATERPAFKKSKEADAPPMDASGESDVDGASDENDKRE